MPDILIRNLDDQAFKRLKQRAKRNRRSLQNEAKLVLQQAVSLSVSEILAEACRQANEDQALEHDIEQWQSFDNMITEARSLRQKLGKGFTDSNILLHKDRKQRQP